jgi:hypothetical protein
LIERSSYHPAEVIPHFPPGSGDDDRAIHPGDSVADPLVRFAGPGIEFRK